MKVTNLTSPRSGQPVANQFLITEEGRGANGNFIKKEVFQSYNSVIAERITWADRVDTVLDEYYWNYSVTTSKYRNLFLGEDKATTARKIKDGTYKLANLN